jgi:dienelactone hydrolase
MIRRILHSAVPFVLLGGAVCLPIRFAAAAEPAELEVKAKALMEALTKGDYDAGAKDFDDTMKKVLPPDKLGETWKGLLDKVGALKKQGSPKTGKISKYDAVWIECEYEKATLYTRVVFGADGKVTGLQFTPSGPPTEYKPPAYVNREKFKETEVKVGSGEWVLPGTLALPVGMGPFPAVVLVHGSGPNDRDETLLGNKPFRDLAWGLASQGVAVLRYEKRSREYGGKLASIKDLTVKEEVLDDALAAVALLQKTPGVDPKRVFVLGHSLGATAAPKLGQLDPDITGVIVMAGAARPIEDLLVEQVEYGLSLVKEPSDEDKAQVEKIKKDVARLKDPQLSPEELASGKLLGASFTYWRSLRSLEPTETAAKIKQPMLILQGERDYQVSMTDFRIWKEATASRKDVALKSYPKLNHLFVEGEGKSRPEEYQKEGHVAVYVIDDIAAWIKRIPD